MVRAPRPPRKQAPTRWANFLVDRRLDRGWSQKAAFEAFRADLGWADDSRASYGALERGQREPDAGEQRYFLEFYGVDELPPEPSPDALGTTETPADLVSAIKAQTEAINALVERLDTFVGPLGDVVAEMLRDQLAAATDRRRSGAAT